MRILRRLALNSYHRLPDEVFDFKGLPNLSRNVMLQIIMSLKTKLIAIKPLTISLFWKMVDQTAYYNLMNF